MDKRVILVRGISGSGKSTLVGKLKEACAVATDNIRVCSSDNFFIVNGEYKFDATKLAQAHSQCFSFFLHALDCKMDVVFVDNTFVRNWELENYIQAARLRGYEILIYEVRVNTVQEMRICAERNVHNVPREVIARMAMDFEDVDSQYQVKLVTTQMTL